MSSLQCFLVEKTGNEKVEPCGCDDKDCKITRTFFEWRRTDTGETTWGHPSSFGPGAMWFEEPVTYSSGKWYWWDNETGPHLIVMYPGDPSGEWDIDSRANNCGRPADRTHRCWIRHGTPPNITVDKVGDTCSAGAGSIFGRNGYHGMLVNGKFESCGDSKF